MHKLPKLNVLVLGSTGSIGTQTLDVISRHSDKFQIAGLVCHENTKLLRKQAKKLKIPSSKICLTSKNPKKIYELIKDPAVDIVVNAISGSQGLKPAIAALKAGKVLALANKESVVLDGANLKKLERKYAKADKSRIFQIGKLMENGQSTKGALILPLDSEHHAVLRLLQTRSLNKFDPKQIKKITITASGGPFFGWTKKRLENATLSAALAHPNWKMGPKITIESATLLNKGYELIEAHHLFAVPLKNLDAIIDRKSFIHAIIEFKKTKTHPEETLALAYKPDMKVVIEDTLLRLHHEQFGGKNQRKFTNKKLKILPGKALSKHVFHPIDHTAFPLFEEAIKAYKSGKIGKFYIQKDRKIQKFIDEKIGFTEI